VAASRRWAQKPPPTSSPPRWSRSSARSGGYCATTGRSFLISATLFSPVLGVEPLVTRAAKHLKVLQRVVVFAEVFVVRVAWRIRLAKLTAMVGTIPCEGLHFPRPSRSVRDRRPTVLPHRVLRTRTTATKTPRRVLRRRHPSQSSCLPLLRRPRLANLLRNPRKTSTRCVAFPPAGCAVAHCPIPFRRPFVRRGATATPLRPRRDSARWAGVFRVRHTHIQP
jgi:hypothetical protein